MRRDFKVPRMEEVLEHDRKLLFALKQSMGFVPVVYAFMTCSETGFETIYGFADVSTVFRQSTPASSISDIFSCL